MQSTRDDRLQVCVRCGVMATKVAAQHLGWRFVVATPAGLYCHDCQPPPTWDEVGLPTDATTAAPGRSTQ